MTRNGDRFEGDFLDRLPHGRVVYVKNPSSVEDDDPQDEPDEVGDVIPLAHREPLSILRVTRPPASQVLHACDNWVEAIQGDFGK